MGDTLLDQAEYVYGFANTSSVIPADCAAAYAGQEWKQVPFSMRAQAQLRSDADAACVPVACAGACLGSTVCRS